MGGRIVMSHISGLAQPWLTQPPRSSIIAQRPDSNLYKYCVGAGYGGSRRRFPNSVHNFCGTGTIGARSDFDARKQANTTGEYRPLVPFAPKADGGLQVGGFHDSA